MFNYEDLAAKNSDSVASTNYLLFRILEILDEQQSERKAKQHSDEVKHMMRIARANEMRKLIADEDWKD